MSNYYANHDILDLTKKSNKGVIWQICTKVIPMLYCLAWQSYPKLKKSNLD